MKRKIFIKEFMGNKRTIFMLLLTLFVVFLLLGMQGISFSQSKSNIVMPDVEISGKYTNSEYFTFELYLNVNLLEERINDLLSDNSITMVESTVRNIMYVEQVNSMNKVLYAVRGFDEGFIKSKLSDKLIEGRLPATGETEILIGYGIAQALELKVGDKVGKQKYTLNGLEGVGIPITLDTEFKDDELLEYTVTGILESSVDYLNYSIILPYSNSQGLNESNVLLLYFNNKEAINTYKELISTVKDDQELSSSIGNVSENFTVKENLRNQIMFYVVSVLLIAITLTNLIISYLVKGVSKRVGILKALGICDKTIISIFIGGLACIVALAFALSIVATIIVYMLLNKEYSNFMGFTVEKYKLTFEIILLQVTAAFVLLFSVFGIIHYKITKLSPNKCMLKK